MSSIDRYKELLRKLAESGSNEFVNNSSSDHAAAMIEVLFQQASQKVCILSDHLNPEVYGRPDVLRAAAEFLSKEGSKMQVIMQFKEKDESKLKENSFLSSLLKTYEGNIELYKAKDDLKNFNYHFFVTMTKNGMYAMRYEVDPSAHVATGSFNSGDVGKNLFEFFEKAVSSSSVQTGLCATLN